MCWVGLKRSSEKNLKPVSDDLEVNIPFHFQGQYYDPEIKWFVSQNPIGFAEGVKTWNFF